MNTDTSPENAGFPPIVLLVEDDRDTLEMYSTFFEMSGVWVAQSTAPLEALGSITELRPDLVITDVGFREVRPAPSRPTLKSRPETRDIPVIVLSGRSTEDIPPATREEAELCLVKPVLPDVLLGHARELIERSHALRDRSDAVRTKSVELRDRSTVLLARAKPQTSGSAPEPRVCPQCSAPLFWVERQRLEGIEYDYYRECPRGCGLYCFDRAAGRWVTLA
jgi:DNA-binding response OmpR family regulator